ncbi:MAG: hypothetical protein V7K25_16875 [Nostoc sp.]
MTAILTRPAWITDLELEIFDKLLDNVCPSHSEKAMPAAGYAYARI